MKKILLIFLLFLLPISANAIVFEKCYISKEDSGFKKDQFEKYEFRVFSEGKLDEQLFPQTNF